MATRRTPNPDRTRATSSTAGSTPTEPQTGGTSAPAARPSRRPASEPTATAATEVSVRVAEETRRSMIAEAAYLRAERRGFAPGKEDEDWLAAETEVDALLSVGQGGRQ